MTYQKWMDKLNARTDSEELPKDAVFANVQGGVWIANDSGTRVDFHDGRIVYETGKKHDAFWYRNQQAIIRGVADCETGVLAEAKEVVAIDRYGRKDKLVMLKAERNGLPVKACVKKNLLKGFPKNAKLYITGATGPVMICLPETVRADGCVGRILPIAIVMPFRFWTCDIIENYSTERV